MAATIDNTPTPTQKGGSLQPAHDKNRHFESVTLTTLGDGHARPSIFAVTPAASTNVEKLMGTLSDPFRIGILSGATRAKDLSRAVTCCYVDVTYSAAKGLFSARVLRKESRKPSSINKSAKTSRHTFRYLD